MRARVIWYLSKKVDYMSFETFQAAASVGGGSGFHVLLGQRQHHLKQGSNANKHPHKLPVLS